jgi:hypothetical protein
MVHALSPSQQPAGPIVKGLAHGDGTCLPRCGWIEATGRSHRGDGLREIRSVDHDRHVVGCPATERLDTVNTEAHGCREVEVSSKELVPRVGSTVTQGQVIARFVDFLGEVRVKERVVIVTDHERRQAVSECEEQLMRRADLLPAQRVSCSEGRSMERRDDELTVGLVVDETGADEPLVGWLQYSVMQGLLEGECLGFAGSEAIHPVVNGQPETIALGGVGEAEVSDIGGQVGRVTFLETEHIRVEFLRKLAEFAARMVFAQVVADDSDH